VLNNSDLSFIFNVVNVAYNLYHDQQLSEGEALCVFRILQYPTLKLSSYEGGSKNNRNLNVSREQEVVARCTARCPESTPYSSSLTRGVSLG
jgi:hypothetical protein